MLAMPLSVFALIVLAMLVGFIIGYIWDRLPDD